MPVELNEPLNTLQRLCEELEYSELLDKAAHTPNPFERMVNTSFQILSNNQYNQKRIQCKNQPAKYVKVFCSIFLSTQLSVFVSVPTNFYSSA